MPCARDRLVVRDHRERLERRLRQAARVPRQHVALDDVVMRGVRVEAPAARDFAQLEAALGLAVLLGEVGERGVDVAPGDASSSLASADGRDGLVGDEQQRLERSAQRAVVGHG